MNSIELKLFCRPYIYRKIDKNDMGKVNSSGNLFKGKAVNGIHYQVA